MKKIFNFFVLILLTFVFAGCSDMINVEDVEVGKVSSIEMKLPGKISRDIYSPEDVAAYKVEVLDSEEKLIDSKSDLMPGSVYKSPELEEGDYQIILEALNESGECIGRGSSPAKVIADKVTSVTIKIRLSEKTEQPEEPEQPELPDQPEQPEQPEEPEQPELPEQPEQKKIINFTITAVETETSYRAEDVNKFTVFLSSGEENGDVLNDENMVETQDCPEAGTYTFDIEEPGKYWLLIIAYDEESNVIGYAHSEVYSIDDGESQNAVLNVTLLDNSGYLNMNLESPMPDFTIECSEEFGESVDDDHLYLAAADKEYKFTLSLPENIKTDYQTEFLWTLNGYEIGNKADLVLNPTTTSAMYVTDTENADNILTCYASCNGTSKSATINFEFRTKFSLYFCLNDDSEEFDTTKISPNEDFDYYEIPSLLYGKKISLEKYDGIIKKKDNSGTFAGWKDYATDEIYVSSDTLTITDDMELVPVFE